MKVNAETTALAIGDIIDAWEDGSLSRNPEYQRGEAWSVTQQKLLIDSILRGYPLPRFYFHRQTGTKGLLGASPVDRFEIIDGQQRIIAMHEFKNNNWSLFDMGVATSRRVKIAQNQGTFRFREPAGDG